MNLQQATLSIIIVNWNGALVLPELLESLSSMKDRLPWSCEMIIVDNGSHDNSINIVEQILPEAMLIRSNVNLGFAGGCNLGAQRSSASYLLFLNPDTIVNADALIKIVEYMDQPAHKDIGIGSVQLVGENGLILRSNARFPRARMFLLRNIALDRFFPSLGHAMLDCDHTETKIVDQVMGAFFLTRRAVFDQLRGFDERFFVYFEEVDYSLRAFQNGYKTIYLTQAKVIHKGEGTTAQVKGKRLFYSLRSRLLYGRKHFNIAENILNFTNTLIVEPISRFIFLISRGNLDELLALREGFGLLYRNLPNIVSKKMRP